jgi:type IV secretory pathway VirB3-like protein
MALPDDWAIPETRALGQRPKVLGLPLGYAALLIMATLFIVLTLHYIPAGIYLFAFGWTVGKLVTFYDPFAWELMAKNLKLPSIMRP